MVDVGFVETGLAPETSLDHVSLKVRPPRIVHTLDWHNALHLAGLIVLLNGGIDEGLKWESTVHLSKHDWRGGEIGDNARECLLVAGQE